MLKLLKTLVKKSDKSNTSKNSPAIESIAEGWHQPLIASVLLDTPLRQQYLANIWQNVSMTPEMFNELYQKPIEKYAERDGSASISKRMPFFTPLNMGTHTY